MKIAVFSDIHSNYQALISIINDIKKENVDKIICLGDNLSKGPNPKECLELIMNNNIDMVLGNHEIYYLHGTDIDDTISDIEKEHQKWVWSNLEEKHKKYLLNCPLEIKIDNLCFKHFLIKTKHDLYPFYSLDILKNTDIFEILKEEKNNYIFVGHEHTTKEYNTNDKKMLIVGSSGCNSNDDTFYTIIEKNDEVKIYKKYLKYDRNKFEEIFNNTKYAEHDEIGKIFFNIY